jgi:transcriptional regulator with XRE-family HTH domain
MTREKLLKSPAYWFEYQQNELFRQVDEYMRSEKINQTELAERLDVSKGYISQILNGNFNYTLKKLIEISLSIGLVPQIGYKKIESVIREDAQMKSYYESDVSIFDNIIQLDPNQRKIEIQNFSEFVMPKSTEPINEIFFESAMQEFKTIEQDTLQQA